MLKCAPLAALEVVILTISSATKDGNFIKMKTFPFGCMNMDNDFTSLFEVSYFNNIPALLQTTACCRIGGKLSSVVSQIRMCDQRSKSLVAFMFEPKLFFTLPSFMWLVKTHTLLRMLFLVSYCILIINCNRRKFIFFIALPNMLVDVTNSK